DSATRQSVRATREAETTPPLATAPETAAAVSEKPTKESSTLAGSLHPKDPRGATKRQAHPEARRAQPQEPHRERCIGVQPLRRCESGQRVRLGSPLAWRRALTPNGSATPRHRQLPWNRDAIAGFGAASLLHYRPGAGAALPQQR